MFQYVQNSHHRNKYLKYTLQKWITVFPVDQLTKQSAQPNIIAYGHELS